MGKKRKGLPRKYVKKWGISKRAWAEYRKDSGKSKGGSRRSTPKSKSGKKRSTSSPKKTNRGGRKRMGRGLSGLVSKIFSLLRVGALAAPAAGIAIRQGPTPEQKLDAGFSIYTGYKMSDGTFDWNRLKQGWFPFIAATLVTVGIPKLISFIRKL